MGAEAALRLDGVHFSFPGRPVFAGFDLAIAAGSHCAVLGASGCGKTTLLQLAAGLLRPQRGAITAGGSVVAGLDPARGLVFQDCALFPWRSALGNAAYGLARQGMPRTQRRERALALLARLGLGAAEAARHPHALSGGQRQRVAIA
ncbi:MAG: ATP-binding cassette domain-containing protein, partial [Planctomycetes bacterium]|nr:ATP-binding cassette domain-containing protein [Planctomycetota bacterium]